MREIRKEHHKKQEREIRRKYKELTSLSDAKRHLGWIELEKPVRKGYERILVPRKDYLRRKDAEYFKELAELIAPQVRVLSIDGEFLKKDFFRKVIEECHAVPRIFYSWEQKKIPEKFRKEFEETTATRVSFRGEYQERVLKLINPWRFEEATIPHFITHVRICDPDLDSRIQELKSYFERNALYGKLDKLLGVGKDPWRDKDQKDEMMKAKRLAQKDVSNQVLEYSLSKYFD